MTISGFNKQMPEPAKKFVGIARKPSFSDSDSLKINLKGSLFEKLFPLRKELFEKYPSANKGLEFSGPGIAFTDGGSFTFTNNKKNDKVHFNPAKGLGFIARYKKDARLFDVALKGHCECVDGLSYLVKYEERKEASPHYVIGAEYTCGDTGLQGTVKLNPHTTKTKIAFLCPVGVCGIAQGVRLAGDAKFFLNQLNNPKHIQFNCGFAYTSPLGEYGASYNHKSEITYTYMKQWNDFTVGIEAGQSSRRDGKDPKIPLVAALSYRVDENTTLRSKLNNNFMLNLGVKKDFSKSLNVTVGTTVDLRKPVLQGPAFGFKVTMKA
eukprot:GEMP01048960.1.p1 GENE.GEMP01048960.1~~GEMP01048960.1.p1  ORF type:complete len:323 (+),score=74.09 GEMP01048960.1:38-1006(+)